MFDDFDYEEYKRQFFNALKSPDVIFSFVMAMIGVIITTIASLVKTKLKLILIFIGIVIVATATDSLRKNIFKHIDDKFKINIAQNMNRRQR